MLFVVEFVHGKYGDDVSINIIYEDRPTSDFNSLFLALSGVYMCIEVSIYHIHQIMELYIIEYIHVE